MRLDAILGSWLDRLTDAALAWREARRAERRLVLSQEDGRFVLRPASAPDGPALAEVPIDSASPRTLPPGLARLGGAPPWPRRGPGGPGQRAGARARPLWRGRPPP